MKKAFWILLAMLCISIAFNVWQWRSQPEASVVVEHDTVWKDSIIREPMAAETIQTGRVVYIKVPVPGVDHGGQALDSSTDVDSGNQAACPHDRPDSIEVPVPIVQKRYEDSLYTAWVSGFEPKLDSIDLRLPTVTKTITKTIVKRSPRLSIGVQAGAGVGIMTHQTDVYVGIGAQWRIWK